MDSIGENAHVIARRHDELRILKVRRGDTQSFDKLKLHLDSAVGRPLETLFEVRINYQCPKATRRIPCNAK